MQKVPKVMLALATILSTSTVLIGMSPVSAIASVNYYNTNISVQGKSVSSPKHIYADDGGNLTAFLPLYYVNQALSQFGVTGSWDGSTWTIATPQGMNVNLSNLPVSEHTNTTTLAMVINGMTVQYAPYQIAGDPLNQYQSTTYLPIWYIDQVLRRLDIGASWDGVNWSLGPRIWTQMKGSPDNVRSLITVNGTIYAGTWNGSQNGDVWMYNNSTWSEMKGSPECATTLLYENGTLYAGTEGLGGTIWAYSNGKWSPMKGAPTTEIWSFVYLDGTLYAGTDSGVWGYSNGSWKLVNGSPKYVSYLLTIDGKLYVGAFPIAPESSVYIMNNGHLVQMSGSPDHVISMLEVNGTLTVAVGVEGNASLWSFSNNDWAELYNLPSGVNSLLYANGTLYAGTSYVTTYGIDGVFTLPALNQMDGIPSDDGVNILLNVNGTLYAGTDSGVYSY